MLLYQTLEGGAWLEITVDTEALTIAVEGDESNRWGPYASWDALCDAFPSVFDAIVAPHGGAEELDDAVPMDLRAVRARRKRRAQVVVDCSSWNERWTRARRLLIDTPLDRNARKRVPKYHRKDVDLSPDGLADTLTYAIAIEIGEGSVAIGGSKLGGLPDLPADADWPEVDGHATALILQIDFAELARVDASQRVRGDGSSSSRTRTDTAWCATGSPHSSSGVPALHRRNGWKSGSPRPRSRSCRVSTSSKQATPEARSR